MKGDCKKGRNRRWQVETHNGSYKKAFPDGMELNQRITGGVEMVQHGAELVTH